MMMVAGKDGRDRNGKDSEALEMVMMVELMKSVMMVKTMMVCAGHRLGVCLVFQASSQGLIATGWGWLTPVWAGG